MSEEMVTITKAEHERLLDASLLLECLEAAGVDNWEWYGDAKEEFEKTKESR